MKHCTFIAISLLLFAAPIYAQQNNKQDTNTDSIKFVSAQWQTRKIAGNVNFKQFHFKDSSLFNSNQIISIVEIKNGALIGDKKISTPKKGKRIITIVADTNRNTVSFLARKNEALAAVNGSFFNMDTTINASVTYLRINGKEVATNQLNKEGKRDFCQKAAIATKGGKMFILKAEDDPKWETTITADDMLSTGPLLRLNGKDEALENTKFNINRHPRTGIATLSDGTLIMITVDGRLAQANGMSLPEFNKIGKWLGAVDMVNLDGGGSTTMFIDTSGAINYPCDNGKFDHSGERKVANAVIVRFRED